MQKEDLSYKEKFIQIDKEALYTLLAALFITIVFWLCIFLFKDTNTTLFYMPLWFVSSCIGGYLLSIVVVIVLIKFYFKNFNLEEKEDKDDL